MLLWLFPTKQKKTKNPVKTNNYRSNFCFASDVSVSGLLLAVLCSDQEGHEVLIEESQYLPSGCMQASSHFINRTAPCKSPEAG